LPKLQALLDKAGIGDDEPIIALGDVVDRGPASPQTLLFLQQRPLTQVLMGNHERKHVRHARGELKLANSQRITIAQFFVYRDLIYGLDTSVYAGKALTGLLLPQFRLVSVPARTNHWRAMRQQYRHVLPKRKPPRPIPPEKLRWSKLAAWLDQDEPSPTQQAERARVEQIVAEAQAVLPQLPATLTALFITEQERLVRDVPDYDGLTPRQQGRSFDAFINHHPPLMR
jgi:hypothetical protein